MRQIPEASNSNADETWAPEQNACTIHSNTAKQNKNSYPHLVIERIILETPHQYLHLPQSTSVR